MQKIKNRVKKVSDSEINDLFNQMLGVGTPDIFMLMDKHEKLLEATRGFLNTLGKFTESELGNKLRGLQTSSMQEILKFLVDARGSLSEFDLERTQDDTLSAEDKNRLNSDPKLMQKFLEQTETKYKFNERNREKCNAFKESMVVGNILGTISDIKKCLQLESERKTTISGVKKPFRDELKHIDYIENADGSVLTLLRFSKLDFKLIVNRDIPAISPGDEATKQLQAYLIASVERIYNSGVEVVKLLFRPDIDINSFATVIINSIDKLKERVPRADEAFKLIRESAEFFKSNFSKYYKDYVVSKDPYIIMEGFLMDLQNKIGKEKINIKGQFNNICSFVKQIRANNPTNMNSGVTDKLIDKLDKYMKLLDED